VPTPASLITNSSFPKLTGVSATNADISGINPYSVVYFEQYLCEIVFFLQWLGLDLTSGAKSSGNP
jgi:hypothetical protein